MTSTLRVTRAQVLLAQLAVELSEEAGEAPNEALKAIANADVVAPQQSTPGHETSADPTRATVHQQVVKPHIFNRDPDDVNPEQAGSPDPPTPGGRQSPKKVPIGRDAEPPVSQYFDPEGRSEEEIDRTIAEDKIKHPERYGRGQGQQREGPDTEERGSGRSGR